MCGRFTLTAEADEIREVFEISDTSNYEWEARYNIAPTQTVAAVLYNSDKQRELRSLYWGLIPSWAKDTKIAAKLINARAETLAEKPSFRSAFKRKRCLVLADGFYEWKRIEKKKQPYYFQLQNKQPFAFAGLWEQWHPDDENITSCTIITTDANKVLQPIHHRMPVMLQQQDYERWLDPLQETEILQQLLQPYPAEEMSAYAVSTKVNNPLHSSPDCIAPEREEN
ncbi:SOS response-associated peptidase [Rivularia sp. UHCC 0363]|uniref:SOS response-associated peptidase n=1 Tax=Rivularia sp. UHCC 0363 TaxID=3110244 RepID=UPI002B220F31|nr:SOS response-associated peptidase [Rivularia sp. UHCC 0363]MEA5594211.1 SOS response-associated peptidase [Rivularia sp. UHCC 0363]